MTDLPPSSELINRLFDAVYPSFAMLAGLELDLFTELENSPLSANQLADILAVKVIKLRPLLYALVVAGLLTLEDDLFSNTSEANHYLVRGKPSYRGGLQELTSSNWMRILATAKMIRADNSIEKFDYHAISHDEVVALYRGLYSGAVEDANRLMSHYDWSHYNSFVDIGGGSGALAITVAQAKPYLKVTVVDLPSVTPITLEFIDEANATDKIEVINADAVQGTLSESYDVVVARHMFQVLSVDDNRRLMNNLATITNPGGEIHIVGWILDNSRLTPEKTVAYNLILINAYEDGQAYTEKEYHTWLSEVGFEAFERVVFLDGSSILSARKST
jgi:2-hydroxy-4-(methylsulfanyl)butanoate S-methyltransferase